MSATVTSVNDGASSVQLLAAKQDRTMASFYNDSTSILYLLLADATASTSNYSVQLAAGAFYELPVGSTHRVYNGRVMGIWSSDASGAVRITEES